MMWTFGRLIEQHGYTVLIYVLFCVAFECKHVDDYNENVSSENSPVEVTAVFIKCALDDVKSNPDSEVTRFEREELFKHNAIRDCSKKLALTVKVNANPNNYGDDFVPIDHVLDGPDKKRVRLLDPYVLRLRRDPPLQAYKLRLIDVERDTSHSEQEELWELDAFAEIGHGHPAQRSRSLRLTRPRAAATSYPLGNRVITECALLPAAPSTGLAMSSASSRPTLCRPSSDAGAPRLNYSGTVLVKTHSQEKHVRDCEHIVTRVKRQDHEQNVVIEQDSADKNIPQHENDAYHGKNEKNVKNLDLLKVDDDSKNFAKLDESVNVKSQPHTGVKRKHQRENSTQDAVGSFDRRNDMLKSSGKRKVGSISNFNTDKNLNGHQSFSDYSLKLDSRPNNIPKNNNVDGSEKDYALYEIGDPDLWLKVHVQMFEKLTTDKGTNLWNDITKGELVSVSKVLPEWSGEDMNVQYRPVDFVPREDYALPMSSLYLLAPLAGLNIDSAPDLESPADNDENFVVVPSEDVLSVDKAGNTLRVDKSVFMNNSVSSSPVEDSERRRKRVIVRVARAMWNIMDDNLNIASHGSDKYLTLPHRRPQHAQVDLEVRADENQLVHIGSSGRIATVVTDSTRPARTAITVQVTNTGLAAAHFRTQIGECDSGLLDLIKEKERGMVSDPVLLPPRHTRYLHMELPVELPTEYQHCTVSLTNDNDKRVAVRDVVLKRGDRCFCVWHCDCACYGDNPKLPCKEMSEFRQDAAGLPARIAQRERIARSVCYKDCMPLDLFVTIVGVILTLLFFGLVKGVIGLVVPSVGVWGLDRVLQPPRKICRYYEASLRQRSVQYDCAGWPVHPDSRQRTVQVINKPMELMLNIVFFIVAPGLTVLDFLKQITRRKRGPSEMEQGTSNTKRCCSTHDVQSQEPRARRRRRALHKWMTPQAEEVTGEVWRSDLTMRMSCCESMLPLLRDGQQRPPAVSSGSDSEHDDTAFVLMHMQKSTESLARIQQKSNASSPSTARHQWKYFKSAGLRKLDPEVHKH